MNAVFANIKRSDRYFNHGDEASSPLNYFPDWKAETCCVTEVDLHDTRPLVLGGGGLFMRDFARKLSTWADHRKVIIWGAGLNYPLGLIPEDLVPALKKCALVGVRDRSFARVHGFEWVPCASCLHPLFQTLPHEPPVCRLVTYQHEWTVPKYLIDWPMHTNMDANATLEEILHYLARARTVVTDSYHGAYWSMLLGRQVIIWKGEAMRFYTGLPVLPFFAHSEAEVAQVTAPEASFNAWANTSFRATSIERNNEFADKVRKTIANV